jgi:hypothetical protein
MLTGLVGGNAAPFSAHALLSLTRIDLIDRLIDIEGYTRTQLHEHILDHVTRITAPPSD